MVSFEVGTDVRERALDMLGVNFWPGISFCLQFLTKTVDYLIIE